MGVLLRVLGRFFNRYLLVEDNEPIAMAIKANNDIQGINPIWPILPLLKSY